RTWRFGLVLLVTSSLRRGSRRVLLSGQFRNLGHDALAIQLIPVDLVKATNEQLRGLEPEHDKGWMVLLGQDSGQERSIRNRLQCFHQYVHIEVGEHLQLGRQNLLPDAEVDSAGEGVGEGGEQDQSEPPNLVLTFVEHLN